jgi:hypothetical protein
MIRLALVAAVVIIGHAQTVWADVPPASIDTFVVLVHPCAYEGLRGAEIEPYRKLEHAACRQWFEAIALLPKSAFAVQIDGGANSPPTHKLHKAMIDRLGTGRVVRIGVEYVCPENPGPLRDYYDRIERRIRQQIAADGLSFDPASAKAIIWGQSFEGCASGYGSAVAHGLGLKAPTHFDYDMSAPDAPFLLDAKYLRTIDVPSSDIVAYIFRLNDGSLAAFFRSCLTPQWLDHRPIRLALNPERFSVLAKNTGEVLWPNGKTLTSEQARSSRYNQWRILAWPQDAQMTGPDSFTLSTVQERFVVGRDLAELIRVVRSAEVRPAVEASTGLKR